MNRFQFVKGRKKENDMIMLFNGLPVKFEDVAKMCLFFMKNEDNLYPPSAFLATVFILPGSEPASGSVKPKHPINFPLAISGKYFSF